MYIDKSGRFECGNRRQVPYQENGLMLACGGDKNARGKSRVAQHGRRRRMGENSEAKTERNTKTCGAVENLNSMQA